MGKTAQPTTTAAARPLNPDIHPWMRQPGEHDAAYNAFIGYRDAEKRRVGDWGPSAFRWSAEWSWGHRCYEYDLFMAQVDLEDQIRYRRSMNERHRKIAAAAQGKLVTWLNGLDPEKMTTADATRLLAVVVEMERRATEGTETDIPPAPPETAQMTLAGRLDGLDIELQDLARYLHTHAQPG